MGSCSHLLCCESISEERSAGNPHATLCGSRKRVTASGDPVVGVRFPRVTRLFITINGVRHYLWRAVDQDGVIDILVQKRRDKRAAIRFFRELMEGQGSSPRRIVTENSN